MQIGQREDQAKLLDEMADKAVDPEISLLGVVDDQDDNGGSDWRLTADAARDAMGTLLGFHLSTLETIDDETALIAVKRLQRVVDRATRASTIDELTGALRRGEGLVRSQNEVERARRREAPLVLMMIDIDGLKAVNDTFGHSDGDRLLRQAVHSVRSQLRSYDLVLRYGGDEFVAVLPDTDFNAGNDSLQRIAAQVMLDTGGNSVSIGIAAFDGRESLSELINRADADMYVRRAQHRTAPRNEHHWRRGERS